MIRYGLQEAKQELIGMLQRATAQTGVPASFPVIARVRVPVVRVDPLNWLAGQKNA